MSLGSVQAWECGSFAHPRVDDTAASPGNSRAGLVRSAESRPVGRQNATVLFLKGNSRTNIFVLFR